MKSSKLPIQSAPVQRTIVGAPMLSGNGVEASGIWDWFKHAAGDVIGWGASHPDIIQKVGGWLGNI